MLQATTFVQIMKDEITNLMKDIGNKVISNNCVDEKDYRASCATYLTYNNVLSICDVILKKMREEDQNG